MYRNDLYSNTSESSRKKGGSWVYINGELYHAGVKGMKWGKHLPGTDWWKETSATISRAYNAGQNNYNRNNPNGGSKIGSTLSGIRNVGTVYGRLGNYRVRKAASAAKSGISSAYSTARSGASSAYNTAKSKASQFYNSKVNPALKRAGNVAKAYGASARVTAKSLVKNLSNRASYGIYKAKKAVSKYANKAYSAVSSAASKYKSKVDNFLSGILGKNSSSIGTSKSLSGKPISTGSKSLTGKPVNKSESSYTKKLVAPTKETPVKRTVTISSQRSPYYKG